MERIAADPDSGLVRALAAPGWVNENVIHEAINIELPDDMDSIPIWAVAQATFDELDEVETSTSRTAVQPHACTLAG